MIDKATMSAVLDSLKDPLLFVDADHVIRYMNQAAIAHYDDGEALLGRSIMDCHNEQSRKAMVEILRAMREDGIDEQLITDDEKHRIYMRAVRDAGGSVLGYYERYEPPAK